MLDKTVPYKNVIMRLSKNIYAAAPTLPEGFQYRMFRKGDEHGWAEIETSVLEFEEKKQALAYFTRDYLYRLAELKERCVFIEAPNGELVATANAWYSNSALGYQASLHWVGVRPEYQGLGLGRAVVKKALSLLAATDPAESVWLHTQTWSHIAIRLYYSLGFRILKTSATAVETRGPEGTAISPNDYLHAVAILKDVYDSVFWNELTSTAEE